MSQIATTQLPTLAQTISALTPRRPAREFKVWRVSELRLLLQNILNVGNCNFERISSFMPGRSRAQCKNKWQNERRRIEKHGSALHDWKTVSVAAVKDCLAIEETSIRNSIRVELLETLSKIPTDIKATTAETIILRQRMLSVFEKYGMASRATSLNAGSLEHNEVLALSDTQKSELAVAMTIASKNRNHESSSCGSASDTRSHHIRRSPPSYSHSRSHSVRRLQRPNKRVMSTDGTVHSHLKQVGVRRLQSSSQYHQTYTLPYSLTTVSDHTSVGTQPFRLHSVDRPSIGTVQLIPPGVDLSVVPSSPYCYNTMTTQSSSGSVSSSKSSTPSKLTTSSSGQ
eukprot:gnl/Dysnectes_brevis/3052_a3781_1144.p1 GENE.gnl/Dysnectes_brevis/3052_a3781_1144~~gnl/Dysnectes_brevis/3052_a3781_1144.p1  ORF type:complete len:369 (+),score=8.34 gnl/Dysnectes_brevis/3052_a3781_1144:82-1107(+)